ncbi:MAG: KH domain-containing protein [Acidobacteriota bacterium]|nr:KH domain-containing protein [Acidobacteriota bacterium]
MSRARDVVEVLARALTDHPDAVTVTESDHRGTTVLELFVAPGDAGKVIGRQGRTIAALRTLVSATAEHEGLKATLEVRDEPARR